MTQPEEQFQFPSLQGRFSSSFLVSPFQVRLTPELLAEFQVHVDAVCKDPARIRGDQYLAGRIRNGEQLGATKSLPPKFRALFCNLGRHYLLQLGGVNGISVNPQMQITLGDSWVVKSMEGDYNPAHKHSGQLSGIVYTKVPPQVSDPSNSDGKLQFAFGQLKEENIDFLGFRLVVPVVGDLYLFPAWLTHLVYPFEGEGERISYSFNLFVQNIVAPHG